MMTTHPRTRKRIEQENIKLPSLVELHRPFNLSDFVNLQMSALAVLSDSGTISEESSILNFPALNIRQAHERPEGMEEGAVMMTGLSWPQIQQALVILEKQPGGADRMLNIVDDYNVPNVSEKASS
jgi:UDP-N-acetylglucosamine 2-epimerase (non-hydrolysing)